MRLVIFGATGRTGLELVRQALDLGHEVTAVVRDAARLPAGLRDRVETVTADLAESERLLRASGLDWTIVRPSRLLDGGPTGRYRTALDLNLRGGRSTTRADLADCMLKLAADPASAGHVVSVAT
ncbi:NAD(P)-dependent oxidoreductase [Nonomuraea sp. NPDC049655]|uniref:NAD(P)-dependent oxidoreductase n=1 Tax=Nonomuraea sp. NPDC049655 TaxID=3364355 RepID=UPI0037A249D4